MKLTEAESRARLQAVLHGVLCTVHPTRGVDAVPVVYASDGEWVGIPVDTVKAKSSTRLQRQRNLEVDPRATLLVEQWDEHDWSQLWWVRGELRFEPDPDAQRIANLASLLVAGVSQYRDRPFATIVVLRVVTVTGWAATPR